MPVWDHANTFLKDLVVYEPGKPVEDVARELGLDPASIIKLASNENPLGPSPKAVEAAGRALAQAHIYPDGGGFHLRNAIAQQFGLDRSQVVLGNGSNEIIEFIYHGFLSAGRGHVVGSAYAFVVYKLMAQLFGVPFVEVPDRNFSHDLAAMSAAIGPDTKAVFVANPNNPTGTRIPNAELRDFVYSVPERVIVVLDEAYYEFLDDAPASVSWLKDRPNLVLLRTFSKIQGLAALRIGYGLMQTELAEVLQRCRQPFNANAPAQAAALAGLLDRDHQDKTRRITLEGRDRLVRYCERKKLPFIPSEANFLMINVGDGDAIFRALNSKGVIVRPLRSYHLPAWIRVSIGTPEQMDRFERELDALLPR
jgi:histidinol-phosphate aminotransferase